MSFRVHSIQAGLGWCHLIECGTALVLVDAGSRGKADRILRPILSLGKPLRLIFITHAHLDHYGNAARIQRETGAPVAVHPADADAMARGQTHLGSVRLWGHVIKAALPLVERFVGPEPVVPDVLIEDGDDFSEYGIAARVVHVPGHTPGSCALLVDNRAAFVGDLVSPMGVPHAQMLYAVDWGQLGESLRRMQALEPEEVYSGHGGMPLDRNTFRRIKPPR
jgi:hydroxyacylglutathione hydrolase